MLPLPTRCTVSAPCAKKQEELLGPFNKKDAHLPILGNRIDLRFFDGKKPLDASRHLLDRLHSANPTFLLGPSGCGKSTAIFEAAKQHFILYMDCGGQSPTTDSNFGIMCSDLLQTVEGFPSSIVQHEATRRVMVEMVARLWYLLDLLEMNPNLKPEEYLLGQLDAGRDVIGFYATKLKVSIDGELSNTLTETLREVRAKLPQGCEFAIAVDEANVAHKLEITNDKSLLDLIQVIVKRHRVPAIYAGTGIHLFENLEKVMNECGGGVNRITEFNLEQDPVQFLSQVIDTSGCERTLQDEKLVSSLKGRIGIVSSVIQTLLKETVGTETKDSLLKRAIEQAVNRSKAIARNIVDVVNSFPEKKNEILSSLGESALRYTQSQGRDAVVVPNNGPLDWVNVGLCYMNCNQQVLTEDLAVEAIFDALKLFMKEGPVDHSLQFITSQLALELNKAE